MDLFNTSNPSEQCSLKSVVDRLRSIKASHKFSTQSMVSELDISQTMHQVELVDQQVVVTGGNWSGLRSIDSWEER